MKLLLPILLAIFGLVGGAAAGWLMKPPPPPEAGACAAPAEGGDAADHAEAEAAGPPGEEGAAAEDCPPPGADEAAKAEEDHADPATDSVFFEFGRQFIVPVVSDEKVAALMVLTLSVEADPGTANAVYAREPKLRDALLRVLFDHAATGGFLGDFTDKRVMRDLRDNLRAAARRVAGDIVRDVLVIDINRQDQ